MSADEWVDDIMGTDEDSDDGEDASTGTSLFADNFKRLVEEEDIESLNVETIRANIEDINDEELLESALEQDSRTTAEDEYESRLSALAEGSDETDEETDSNDEDTASETDEVDQTQTEEEPEDAPDEDEGEATEGGGDGEQTEQGTVESLQKVAEDVEDSEDADTPETNQTDSEGDQGVSDGPQEVDVSGIAPDAVTREEAVETQADSPSNLLVWGQEGTGKTHVAHTAPGPIAYIDTENKADKIAHKFEKDIYYFAPDDYQEATDAMDQALDLLSKYRNETGQVGTIVVDSITVIWDWAKQDYMELAFPSADDPSEVDFKSALQGEDDWSQIKRRHNQNFRKIILESPYNVVFTATAKEDYNAVIEGADGKPMKPDGERDNRYKVDDVVRLRTDDDGETVADLQKAAKSRYSFVDLAWPEWEDIYDAIEMLSGAEATDEQVDVASWPFGVVDGQPVQSSGGSDDGGGEDDE